MIAWIGGFVIGFGAGIGLTFWSLSAYLQWDREQRDQEYARWPDEL